jgi:hypothetical protein
MPSHSRLAHLRLYFRECQGAAVKTQICCIPG